MAFKMKGHALRGPYQQQEEEEQPKVHQGGDIEASGKAGDAEFNQPIDDVNAQRVEAMRDADHDSAVANYEAHAQSEKDFADKVNAFTDAGKTMDENQQKQTKDQFDLLEKNKDEAYDSYIGALNAHNYSADSTNVANKNAAARAAADFDKLFE